MDKKSDRWAVAPSQEDALHDTAHDKPVILGVLLIITTFCVLAYAVCVVIFPLGHGGGIVSDFDPIVVYRSPDSVKATYFQGCQTVEVVAPLGKQNSNTYTIRCVEDQFEQASVSVIAGLYGKAGVDIRIVGDWEFDALVSTLVAARDARNSDPHKEVAS